MAEKSGRRAPFDRGVEQAIVALKKGAHLLRCGRRGKPKFCPFRLSTDEKSLIWYSGEKEKCLKLSSVSKINFGQKTANFRRHLQPEKESQSFSLLYQNGERSLDLICKDKEQAECWLLGLTALLPIYNHPRPLAFLPTGRSAHSCLNSPVSHLSAKYTLKVVHDSSGIPQVCSVYGSPPRKLLERYVSDNFLDTSDLFYSLRKRTLSDVQDLMDEKLPFLTHKSTKDSYQMKEHIMSSSTKTSPPDKGDCLKDVFMWGEGVGVFFGEKSNAFETNGIKVDVLLPKLLESTRVFDLQSISCGEKHVGFVTKEGEVFCWGEGNGGKLGHKVNLDVTHPKIVESLSGIFVQTIACGSKQTCAVTRSGELYVWGNSCVCEGGNRSHWIPYRLSNCLIGIKILKVACGEWHTAIVSSFGQLFTYGEGTFGALGHGNQHSSSQPKEVEFLKNLRVKSVACGPWHTAAIVEVMVSRFKSNTSSGKLFTWGDSDKGRLGHADKERKLVPTCIASLVDCDFVQVSCGRTLTVALTVTGLVITMGSAMNGQLGNPRAEDTTIATVEGFLKNEFVKDLSSGSSHVAVLTTKGNVYTWGKGDNGRLGLGDTKDRDSPALVEALQDRNVQNVVCGFNFTAAVCLHKSLSSKDQLLCTGCRMAFGFTRKKHNCYHCGSVFCHSCSSKKALNASLAPNKTRRFRVCDLCYTRLEKLASSRMINEAASPRQFSMIGKGLSDLRLNREESLSFLPKIFTPKSTVHDESMFLDGKSISTQSADQQNKDQFLSGGAQRWGQVPCPPRFKKGVRNEFVMFKSKSKEQVSNYANINTRNRSKSMLPKATSLKQDLTVIDKFLAEELQQLQEKAISLTQQCQSKSLKLQQYKRRIEETCLVASEEAAKCKAAKNLIKVLRTQVNVLSEKIIIAEGPEKETRSVVDDKLTGTLSSKNSNPEVKKVTSESTQVPNNGISTDYNAHSAVSEARKCSSNSSKDEWVEHYGQGVYISFAILPNGQKGLKRVRFSRKRFNEKEAEKWWEENRCRIFEKYGIEPIDTTFTRKMTSDASIKCDENLSSSKA
ncbi:PH, RCC1 and FYVE domains-containing protein 1 isoform X1 [Dendrobium catenatum]|uniref:PH, RCC1 and FYVE domains-containing protein 1 isoform X1 n=1 Tax=Dendrobium catenatum TaxID=906689 RepID=UPI0009F39047|nr:PH, RCC1 and FYVE domains-containing protein 1 isoform X1 [Dendrobium catenatum]